MNPKVYNKYHNDAPKKAVYVGRPTVWGNPFSIGNDGTREEVLEKFKVYLKGNAALMSAVKSELKGHHLVCFCKPLACHADVLLEVANGTSN